MMFAIHLLLMRSMHDMLWLRLLDSILRNNAVQCAATTVDRVLIYAALQAV